LAAPPDPDCLRPGSSFVGRLNLRPITRHDEQGSGYHHPMRIIHRGEHVISPSPSSRGSPPDFSNDWSCEPAG
jgi:hypothetical protein